MKKKLLLTLLALAAVLSLSGCIFDGNKEQTTTTTTTKSAGQRIGDGIGEVIDGISGLF